MENKPEYKTKTTGPASLAELRGEPFTSFRFMLSTRHHDHLKTQALKNKMSAAEYLRHLIDNDMS
jgi:hypothetical protein